MANIWEWAWTMAYISITWDGLSFENQISKPHHRPCSLCRWVRQRNFSTPVRQLHNYTGQDASFLGCIHGLVRHKQLLDTFQGKVLYFIWSPGSLIWLTQILPSSIICVSHSFVVPSWFVILLEGRKLRMTFTVGMSSPHSQTWYSILSACLKARYLSMNRGQISETTVSNR